MNKEYFIDMDFDYYYDLILFDDEDAEYGWGEMSYSNEMTDRWNEEPTELELFESQNHR